MRKIVVKIGSSVVAPGGRLDSSLVSKIVEDILTAEKLGYRVILVSSGAIACGLDKLGYKRKPQDTHSLMAISSLGQILLMDTFNAKFNKYNRMCAQMLLTWEDFDSRTRFINIRKTLNRLLNMKVIPIINENDAVSCEEIRLGDNDCISARVADLCEAEQLIILSDVEGLLDGDKLIQEVSKIDAKIVALAKKEDKTHTHGGMETKLCAARIATASGIKTVIAYGRKKQVISGIIKGQRIGTLFKPLQKIGKARKRWIVFSKKVKGKILIDSGAQDAILHQGRSLLGVGIVKSQGEFKAGDAVSIFSSKGDLLGYGIVNYDSESISKQKKFEKEVVHRDNFASVAFGGWYDL